MRRRWKAAIGALVLLIALGAAGWPVYVSPKEDFASVGDPADAVIALGGNSTQPAHFALELLREGKARTAVLSNPYGPYVYDMVALCRDPAPDVTCFNPEPGTTRGEAQEIARLAEANGWDDVIVTTATPHISRARYIIGRCYSGRLRMLDAHTELPAPAYTWPREYVYQTVAFIKAAAQRGC